MNNVNTPLFQLSENRQALIERLQTQFRNYKEPQELEQVLGEVLFTEKMRLRRVRFNVFTRSRKQKDIQLISHLQKSLLCPAGEVDRVQLLDNVVKHYAQEVAGQFNRQVYQFAVNTVPWFFNYLLNAASLKQVIPWKQTHGQLDGRLHFEGKIKELVELSKKGTVLLVPTHQSNIDSVLIGYSIYKMGLPPFCYGAGLNLFSNPVLSFFMSNLGAYTVDRHKQSSVYKDLLKSYSEEMLHSGIHSIFFPGGGRSRSGALESKLKLGLLGTALDAQVKNYQSHKAHPKVFIVPMVMSYHFVLEAASLIEDFLVDSGKSKYFVANDESSQVKKVLQFFWKFFAVEASITVRVGQAMDVFGNLVSEDGESIGPNGLWIDPKKWLTSFGQIQKVPQRDQEYTRELGVKLSNRFHVENTVLHSHVVAFVLFEELRLKYPEYDLYQLLRLTQSQRYILLEHFKNKIEAMVIRLKNMERAGQLYLSHEFKDLPLESWFQIAVKYLGCLHEAKVVKIEGPNVTTEDMSLLYYYRNRLAGYGLSLRGMHGRTIYDTQGFLV